MILSSHFQQIQFLEKKEEEEEEEEEEKKRVMLDKTLSDIVDGHVRNNHIPLGLMFNTVSTV